MKPLRERQKQLTRGRILHATESVLRAGEALTFARVAAAAELPERTVYRYFPTREELERAAWQSVLTRFANARDPEALDEYCDHVREAFARFSDDGELVRAILHSPEVVRLRATDDDKRRNALERTVQSAVPGATSAERKKLAAALRVLYSAPAWELLTDLWGLDAREAAEVVTFAARSMLSGVHRNQARRQK